MEECDQEENLEVNEVAATSCLKRKLQNVLSNVTHSGQAEATMINIQSTFRTASNLCRNVSVAVLFGSNGNSYTVCMQSDMLIYTYCSQYRDADRAKEINNLGQQ